MLRESVDLDVPQTAPQPIGKRPALVLLNDGDITYAKIRFDAASFETVRTGLSGLPDPPHPRGRLERLSGTPSATANSRPPATWRRPAPICRTETDLAIAQGVLAFAAGQLTDQYLTPRSAPPPSPPSPRSAATCCGAPRTATTPACG